MNKNDDIVKNGHSADNKMMREERLREELRKNLRKRKGQKNLSRQEKS